jgi:Phytanoyl-CoA dioxygenase (PhyH)
MTIVRTRVVDEAVERLREVGWAVLDDALTPEQLSAALAEAKTLVPTVEEYEALTGSLDAVEPIGDPTKDYHSTHAGGRAAAWQSHRLSGSTPALLGLGVQPWVLDLATRLLDDDPVLDSMTLSAKYARGGEAFDQGFHIDPLYATYPRASTPSFRFWIYLTDVTDDHGPTELVTLDDRNDLTLFADPTPDFSGWYYEDDRRDALQGRVHAATGAAGSILVYQARTHHRATPFAAASGCRWIAAFAFRAASWGWLATSWDHPRTGAPVRPDFAAMSVDERTVLGFPPVGDPYWDDPGAPEEVERIFAGIDLAPYRAAAS